LYMAASSRNAPCALGLSLATNARRGVDVELRAKETCWLEAKDSGV
jgi:hypothetical protein